ncbi:MAG: efflux RND transporter periplasmic adaptor subunit, partial [Isosphaeraceae bacterium]
ITRGDLRSTVTATGTLNAVTTVLVGTQVSGMIKKLHADFNSPVKKGQIVAEIDPATFEAAVENAKENLAQAWSTVQKDKATLADATRIRDRYRKLFAKGYVDEADYTAAETTHDADEAQLAADSHNAMQMEAVLQSAKINLDYTKIVCPVDGVVVSRNVDVGQTVAASFTTPTLFTIAQDLTKMQIDTNVDEADIGRVKVPQDVEFTVDAYPDRTFHGTVKQIRIAPIIVQNVVTYDVVITVDNTDLKLMPGMTANVSVVVASKEGVLKVPNAALRFKPTEKDGVNPQAAAAEKAAGRPPAPSAAERGSAGPPGGKTGGRPGGARSYSVWILQKHAPQRVPVTIGISDGTFSEVTTGDLREGQEVIVESSSRPLKSGGTGGSQSIPRFIR